jgi:hypothetical protein
MGIYGIPHPTKAEYTFFLGAKGTLTKIYYVLGHKMHFNKFKRREI